MRVIGDIQHPTMKITVFKHNDKVSIKFEKNLLEQIFKFRDGGAVVDLDTAKQFCSEQICTKVEDHFNAMSAVRSTGNVAMQQVEFDKFPKII